MEDHILMYKYLKTVLWYRTSVNAVCYTAALQQRKLCVGVCVQKQAIPHW